MLRQLTTARTLLRQHAYARGARIFCAVDLRSVDLFQELAVVKYGHDGHMDGMMTERRAVEEW